MPRGNVSRVLRSIVEATVPDRSAFTASIDAPRLSHGRNAERSTQCCATFAVQTSEAPCVAMAHTLYLK